MFLFFFFRFTRTYKTIAFTAGPLTSIEIRKTHAEMETTGTRRKTDIVNRVGNPENPLRVLLDRFADGQNSGMERRDFR